VISLAATVGRARQRHVRVFLQGVITLVLTFTLFGWFYPARIMRASVLSIREEYVEAARMVGRATPSRTSCHLSLIVYSTLIVASYVLFEAGLSFLGVGIKFNASWGTCSGAVDFYTTRPLLMVCRAWPCC
jgi:ABC-type dipeptide/oligopeptide/nickel transport system permease subunit